MTAITRITWYTKICTTYDIVAFVDTWQKDRIWMKAICIFWAAGSVVLQLSAMSRAKIHRVNSGITCLAYRMCCIPRVELCHRHWALYNATKTSAIKICISLSINAHTLTVVYAAQIARFWCTSMNRHQRRRAELSIRWVYGRVPDYQCPLWWTDLLWGCGLCVKMVIVFSHEATYWVNS